MESASADAEPGLINCLMLVSWPARREMIQHAVHSFLQQDYPARTLTLVNDGEPCRLAEAFERLGCRGCVVDAPAGATIGEKRNIGAAAVPTAEFIASFDDDDFSLPSRLRLHVERMGSAVAWLSASRKFISLQTLDNVVGFEHGRCFGAGMIRTEVWRALPWPHVSYREDQKMYEAAREHPSFGASRMIDADDLTYVHRRHETNASAAHRQSLWQGVMPVQLAGAEALAAVDQLRALLASPAARGAYLVNGDGDADAPPVAKKPRSPLPASASASASELRPTVTPLSQEEKDRLNVKYGRIQPQSARSQGPAAARPSSAVVTPLSREERERLNAKYGRIQPPSAEEVRKLGQECKMQ